MPSTSAPSSDGGYPVTSYTVTAIDLTNPAGDKSEGYPPARCREAADAVVGELLGG